MHTLFLCLNAIQSAWKIPKSGICYLGATTPVKRSKGAEPNEAEGQDSEEDNSAGLEDDEDTEKRKLRHIFPVTPASLSATRTRKVSIPKFYAYGM